MGFNKTTQQRERWRRAGGTIKKCASIDGRARDIFLLVSVKTSTGVNPASVKCILWVFLREERDRSLKLTSHLSNMEVNP